MSELDMAFSSETINKLANFQNLVKIIFLLKCGRILNKYYPR